MCLTTDLMPGVQMGELTEEERTVVEKELQQHIETLKSLRSHTPCIPGLKIMMAPQRVCGIRWKYDSCWQPDDDVKGDFVLCHNDLAQHNVLVDPKNPQNHRDY